MKKVIPLSFFQRKSTKVAEEILGKYIVRKTESGEIALKITEVEVYDGREDKASHAFRGKTARNEIMFEEGGRLYVYFIYGMHYMINIVTGPKDYPAALLLRGTIEVSGPGRLATRLGIDRSFNRKKLIKKEGVWIEDRGEKVSKKDIIHMPRINIAYAGEEWAQKPLRYICKSYAE